MDPIGGNDANSGLSFALRRKTTLPTLAAGDEVRYMKSADPISVGDVTWTNNSTLELATARTLDLYNDGTAWVPNTNVTGTTNANRKTGATTTFLTVAAGFTTGRIGHYITGAKDCSGYNKVHVWIRFSAVVTNLSNYSLVLCSDTAGTVAVNTLPFPAINTIANTYMSFTLDNAGPLGSTINSVALYATSDPGALTILLDNIFCTNDISCGSVISKDNIEAPDISAGEEVWWPIRSIVGTTITLEYNGTSSIINVTNPGYYGTTETVESYIIQPTIWPNSAATIAAVLNTLAVSGSIGSPIIFTGGWNTTDMSSRTGCSWYSFLNSGGYLFALSGSRSYLNFEHFGCHSGYRLFTSAAGATFINMSKCYTAANINYGIEFNSSAADAQHILTSCATIGGSTGIEFRGNNSAISYIKSILNGSRAIEFPANAKNVRINNCEFADGSSSGVVIIQSGPILFKNGIMARGLRGLYLDRSDSRFEDISISQNSTCAVQAIGGTYEFRNLITDSDGTYAFDFDTNTTKIIVGNWVYSEASPILSSSTRFTDSYIISVKDNGVAEAGAIYFVGGSIDTQNIVRHTASGIAWRMRPTSTDRSSTYPLRQRINSVFCESGVEKTVSVWVRRDHADITGRLLIKAYEIPGISSDISDSITVGADTWEQLSVTFTPTESRFIDVYIECWGGTTHSFYWDDFSASPTSSLDTSGGDYLNINSGAGVAALGGSSPATPATRAYAFIS